ncbi:MAG TPA: arginine--tRNA ligase [Anaerolineales bacterium]|nr:arginine--tRNA ligase [Anaerolineales bacterium]
MFETEQQAVEAQIRQFIAENQLPDPGEFQWTPIPFAGEWGISTSFFQLAAKQARAGAQINVPQRAQEIAAAVAEELGLPSGFARLEAVKGYLNLYYSPGEFTQRVVDEVLEQGQGFGRGAPKGEQVMVEFSQPNTHKAFHVGHLRSAILGEAIARILEHAGYQVVRSNYIGDIGLHVIKWMWNYLKYHAGELPPDKDRTRWMGDLYAEASRRLEENPDLESEVRALFGHWDRKEPEIVALWENTRQWSLDGFAEVYQILDIRFDRYYYNSEVEEPGKAMVEELVRRGIAVDERPDGPVFVRIDEKLGLEKEKYRVLVILRSDSTALYGTEDLALAILKFNEFDLARSIYVVDVRQSLYFQQVFKILEIMGYSWAERCYHLAYELVNLPGNVVIASREGAVVLLEDMVREATRRALEIVREKNPSLPEEKKREVAFAVGLGALKYPMLARDNTRIVTFDWEVALDFNGQAAPYIQYAHVRANSILNRLQEDQPIEIHQGEKSPVQEIGLKNNGPSISLPPARFEYRLDPSEVQLIDLISRFPGEVQRAAAEYKTLPITNLAYELARAFTEFYNACPVLKADPDVRAARLRLVAAARQAIANVLNLLGIIAPQVM